TLLGLWFLTSLQLRRSCPLRPHRVAMAKSIQSSKTATVKFSTLSSSRSSRGHNQVRSVPPGHQPGGTLRFQAGAQKSSARFVRREKKLRALEWIYVRLSLRAFSFPFLFRSSHFRGSPPCVRASRRAPARSRSAA